MLFARLFGPVQGPRYGQRFNNVSINENRDMQPPQSMPQGRPGHCPHCNKNHQIEPNQNSAKPKTKDDPFGSINKGATVDKMPFFKSLNPEQQKNLQAFMNKSHFKEGLDITKNVDLPKNDGDVVRLPTTFGVLGSGGYPMLAKVGNQLYYAGDRGIGSPTRKESPLTWRSIDDPRKTIISNWDAEKKKEIFSTQSLSLRD
jgi:hypothetical protein